VHLLVFILTLDDVADEQILQTDNLPKSKPAYLALKSVIGPTSLVAIGGDHWKKLRKMFNPAFAPSHLETMIPCIVEESQVFVEKLNEVANTGKVVEMNNLTTVRNLSS
jgi:cytochrome P450